MNWIAKETEGVTLARRHAFFGLFSLGLAILVFQPIQRFVSFSLHEDQYNSHSSYILLIPFISAALVFLRREQIFSDTRTSLFLPLSVVTLGSAVYSVGRMFGTHLPENDYIALLTLGII